jgi:hypothetical protein
MDAITVERVRERRDVKLSALVAYVGAAAFVVAAVWATLASRGITVASEPAVRPNLSVHDNQLIYLQWLLTKQPQERVYTSIAMAAFLCLLATAVGLRGRFDRTISSLAVQSLAVGVVLWVIERTVHLGAEYGLGMLTTHHYTTETITGIGFTVDMVTRALEVTGFAIIGLGMLAFAARAMAGTVRRPGWGRCSAAIGASMIIASWATLAGAGTVGDVLVALVGAVLLPVWMCWSAALLAEEVPIG